MNDKEFNIDNGDVNNHPERMIEIHKESAGESGVEDEIETSDSPPDKIAIGKKAEREAQKFLWNKGYRIIAANVFFRDGEIDIVGTKNHIVKLIEVRKKQSYNEQNPLDALGKKKIQSMKTAARSFLSIHNMEDYPAEIDLVIVNEKSGKYNFELFENIIN